MSDLNRRIATSSVIIAFLVCFIVFAFNSIFQYVVVGAVSALAGIAVWEYQQFAEAKGGKLISPALIILTVAEVFSFFLYAKYPELRSLPLAIFFAGLLILFALYFKENEGAIVNLAVSSFGLLYVAVPVGMILGILYSPKVDGRWWMTYLLVVTKITDVGGYFAGNLWGKTKLAPTISPKKTVEGAIFGLFCATAASFAFHMASDYVPFFSLGNYQWLFLGLVLGVVGQFGDLSESLLKRDAKKKDSNVLPGLGGVLDSIDSILFNAIIIFIYLYYIRI